MIITKAIDKFLQHIVGALVVILMSVLVADVSIGVFFRYVLNNALFWTEELARYSMVWMGFLGMCLALRNNEHVSIAFFYDRLPPLLRKIVRFINLLLVLTFIVIVFRYSLSHIRIVKFQTSPSMSLPMIWPYLSVTVGTALMILESVRQMIVFFMDLRNMDKTKETTCSSA
jgi:TRAP-type C4-dicarboxylate transport system permease small subunit